ncbi:MAG: DUF4870 domain-containing protein [Limnothrix sp. CACIAM 69d]|uniref:DUF4870 domain-containing protein n=1 Tax=Limnothrix sp. FACHB-881 TaxID=2692819 RepID=UPI00095C37F0|nr:DUF4870 domain-containing protein [Limnothrix sp. FACHB-881]MBD2636564.1 DUF4870 domain-containing protein [Limnothrix sp. FACHB-881]RFP56591.1 MAG: DUF4870 domain-containing protein [Limnothrix sp. CACIAM 69d]
MGWQLGQWQFEPWRTDSPQPDQSDWLATLAHWSVFLGCGLGMVTLAPIGVDRAVLLELVCCGLAIAIMVAAPDPRAQANARSAVNFHLNVLVAAALCSALVGIPFLIALTIKALVSPLLAAARVAEEPGYIHHYDFLWQWLNPDRDRVGI